METGSEQRGTYMSVVDKEGNFLTANAEQAYIAPLKKDADLTAVINKVNDVIAALKRANIIANKD